MIAPGRPAALVSSTSAEWDVVVIGAGPAGGIAAVVAARSGRRVLLVERRRFPREKVCGGCLNARGVEALRALNVCGPLLKHRAVPLDRFRLQCGARELLLPLPPGVAINRAELDAALVDAAVAAGAEFRSGVQARLLPDEGAAATRSIQLTSCNSGEMNKVTARTVILASGLGAPGVADETEIPVHVARNSRLGLGAILPAVDNVDLPQPGEIRMAVGQLGYAGLVRLSDGRVNVAAAVDRSALAGEQSPADVIEHTLASCGLNFPRLHDIAWRGTGLLTRSLRRSASHRVLVVGDAAGYAEPFTGEGMATALTAGAVAGKLASEHARDWTAAHERQWQTMSQRIQTQGATWRWLLPRLVRRVRLAGVSLAAASWAPAVPRLMARAISGGVHVKEVLPWVS